MTIPRIDSTGPFDSLARIRQTASTQSPVSANGFLSIFDQVSAPRWTTQQPLAASESQRFDASVSSPSFDRQAGSDSDIAEADRERRRLERRAHQSNAPQVDDARSNGESKRAEIPHPGSRATEVQESLDRSVEPTSPAEAPRDGETLLTAEHGGPLIEVAETSDDKSGDRQVVAQSHLDDPSTSRDSIPAPPEDVNRRDLVDGDSRPVNSHGVSVTNGVPSPNQLPTASESPIESASHGAPQARSLPPGERGRNDSLLEGQSKNGDFVPGREWVGSLDDLPPFDPTRPQPSQVPRVVRRFANPEEGRETRRTSKNELHAANRVNTDEARIPTAPKGLQVGLDAALQSGDARKIVFELPLDSPRLTADTELPKSAPASAHNTGQPTAGLERSATPLIAAPTSTTTETPRANSNTSAARSSEQIRLNQTQQRRLLSRVSSAFRLAQMRDGEIRLRLSPPELGSIKLEMKVQDQTLVARVRTETEAARATLLENLPVLRDRLTEQGIQIEAFDIEVGDESDESSAELQRDQSDEQTNQESESHEQTSSGGSSDDPSDDERSFAPSESGIVDAKSINVVV